MKVKPLEMIRRAQPAASWKIARMQAIMRELASRIGSARGTDGPASDSASR